MGLLYGIICQREIEGNTMNMKNLFVKSAGFFVACMAVFSVDAAENDRGRASMMPNTVVNGSSSVNSARMPVMPIVTMNTIGNPAVHTVSEPAGVNNQGIIIPTPPTPPHPDPDPDPDPEPECPDGGVKNTEYTVSMCMAELQQCVDAGAVSGGLHGLFNEDMFNRLMNGGLNICQNVIDKCLDIRVNCHKVYTGVRPIWMDFKTKILMPEYYNFVLYKTGLTPNQAKKTCLNIGGKWDAVSAECIVCVTAHNKEIQIKNSWLFGIAGDERYAEACLPTGSSFTCNKDLFGFSLLNDTATVAATAIPGGAIVGATTGGIIAKAKQNKALANPCESSDYRKKLGNQIKSTNNDMLVSSYFDNGVLPSKQTKSGETVAVDFYNLTETQCNLILDLYSKAKLYDDAIRACENNSKNIKILNMFPETNSDVVFDDLELVRENGEVKMCVHGRVVCEAVSSDITEVDVTNFGRQCMFKTLQKGYLTDNSNNPLCETGDECVDVRKIKDELSRMRSLLNNISMVTPENSAPSVGKGILIGGLTGAGVGGLATGITALIESSNIKCKVGDNLGAVALGKSYKIDSLKDFYVKRGLNIPDTVLANTPVVDKNSWGVACSEFLGNSEDCWNASIILKQDNKRQTVSYACKMVGSMCLMNEAVASLYGIE